MAEKARDAFRTISEVANWLDVPAHVLRFWESKFPQIKPVKRAGGRRYYRPADMELIGGIKKLLHDDGLTIRGVQKMIKEDGIKAISALSPPLDMPSEEEAAARRKARRARRQARQAARTKNERLAPPTPPAPPSEADGEAPFTHVEETDPPTEADNVVPMPSRDSEPSSQEVDATLDAEAEPVIINDAAPEPGHPVLEEATDALEDSAEEAQASFALMQSDDAEPGESEDAEGRTEAPEAEAAARAESADLASAPSDAPDAASQEEHAADTSETIAAAEPAPTPVRTRPIVDTGPLDMAAIEVDDAQRMRIKRLRKFRRLNVGTVFASGSQDAVAQAHDRLQTLRDRLAIDLERR
ncbi:MAG: MerR family transcriptional regulator [Pseudomonadota bacterium]